jgi:hypothetical protein
MLKFTEMNAKEHTQLVRDYWTQWLASFNYCVDHEIHVLEMIRRMEEFVGETLIDMIQNGEFNGVGTEEDMVENN